MPDDTRNTSNIRSWMPAYRSIPRGIANYGRSLYDQATGRPLSRGPSSDRNTGMIVRRAMGSEQSRNYKRQNYRNGSR